MKKQEGSSLERLWCDHRAKADDRKRVYIRPKRIVWETGAVQNSASLLEEKSRQISLSVGQTCVLENQGEGAAVLLDFGQELHGGAEIAIHQVKGAKDAQLRIRFGESAMEAMSELGGATNATNDHARRDLIMTAQSWSMNPVMETGFRFVRIDLLTPGVRVSIHAVHAILVYRDVPYLGSFRCSDPLLNEIWDVGAYTVHLNMQQYVWDGIKRDRLVWIGDLYPEIATLQTVFGNQKIIRDSLDFAVERTPESEWMNGIPSYSMWWIIIQYDYFRQFGDRAYLEQQLPYMRQVCRLLAEHLDERGRDITPSMRFVDWPTQSDPAAVDLGLQALHLLAVKRAAEMFACCGDQEMSQQCELECEKIRSFPVAQVEAKQANALAVWAGLLHAQTVNETNLKVGGAAGLSTFMGYFILQARAQAGDVTGALDTIREYWGGMLKLGATSFWEDFDIRWLERAAPIDRLPEENEIDVHGTYGGYCYKGYRHSLCHGWASGPTSWLTQHVLGIEVLEPGCRKIRIQPNLCGLQWASGTYPTPEGVLEVEHRLQEDGKVSTTVRAPEGIDVIFQ